jgi:hypothetical protein
VSPTFSPPDGGAGSRGELGLEAPVLPGEEEVRMARAAQATPRKQREAVA